MISEYLKKTQTEMTSNLSKFSKTKKNPLIYNNCRNSTGMNFKKKKPSNETHFVTEFLNNNDSRSISVPFAKSSENINQVNVSRGDIERKRASTTDKFGPR